ncbi:hypothetical protein WJX72_007940 [[Myrmecia] bisecta]|uniref:Uncharacterized protein n=1 Tax=[Myrmecia] bisecta TaxID=41462 RepID=A0AAW1PQK5_9CHLO
MKVAVMSGWRARHRSRVWKRERRAIAEAWHAERAGEKRQNLRRFARQRSRRSLLVILEAWRAVADCSLRLAATADLRYRQVLRYKLACALGCWRLQARQRRKLPMPAGALGRYWHIETLRAAVHGHAKPAALLHGAYEHVLRECATLEKKVLDLEEQRQRERGQVLVETYAVMP